MTASYYSIDTYGVIGNPITHSRSPEIHLGFAKQTQQVIDYIKLNATQKTLKEVINKFKLNGGKGLNITLPFKQSIIELVDELSLTAKQAQAVNTLRFDSNGNCYGDNTDGIGLIRDFEQLNIKLKDQSILLLGAGGAARGILPAIITEQPKAVMIANRTIKKAKKIISDLHTGVKLEACPLNKIPNNNYNLIINTTSAFNLNQSLDIELDFIKQDTVCYDVNYNKTDTGFITLCKQAGTKYCYDGLGMLYQQAAESFFIWRGVYPEINLT